MKKVSQFQCLVGRQLLRNLGGGLPFEVEMLIISEGKDNMVVAQAFKLPYARYYSTFLKMAGHCEKKKKKNNLKTFVLGYRTLLTNIR